MDDRNPLKIVGLVDEDCATVAFLPADTIYAPDGLVKNLLPDLSVGTDS